MAIESNTSVVCDCGCNVVIGDGPTDKNNHYGLVLDFRDVAKHHPSIPITYAVVAKPRALNFVDDEHLLEYLKKHRGKIMPQQFLLHEPASAEDIEADKKAIALMRNRPAMEQQALLDKQEAERKAIIEKDEADQAAAAKLSQLGTKKGRKLA